MGFHGNEMGQAVAIEASWSTHQMGGFSSSLPSGYVKHSYWKWWFIVEFPIKNGDFP